MRPGAVSDDLELPAPLSLGTASQRAECYFGREAISRYLRDAMPVNTKPAGPKTGYAHPKCYARALADCATQRSKEHYISKKLLKRLGNSFVLDGVSWHDGPRDTVPDEFQAKVLCTRHNTALSPLDEMITDVFDVSLQWNAGEAIGERLIDGEDLERWALKALLGKLTSGHAIGKTGAPTRTSDIPTNYIRILFGEDSFPYGCGLYLGGSKSHPPNRRGVELTAISADGYPGIFGASLSIGDFDFILSLNRRMDPRDLYRPSKLRLEGSGIVRLRWPEDHVGAALLLRTGSRTDNTLRPYLPPTKTKDPQS